MLSVPDASEAIPSELLLVMLSVPDASEAIPSELLLVPPILLIGSASPASESSAFLPFLGFLGLARFAALLFGAEFLPLQGMGPSFHSLLSQCASMKRVMNFKKVESKTGISHSLVLNGLCEDCQLLMCQEF